MAGGTQLREMSEHIAALEEKLQHLTSHCGKQIEESIQQYTADSNKQMGILAQQIAEIQHEGRQRYESLQIEAAKRHEVMQQEGARRHQQLLELLTAQTPPPITDPNPALRIREEKPAACNRASSSGLPWGEIDKGNGILPTPMRGHDLPAGGASLMSNRNQYHIPFPKLEFPIFNGEEARAWVDRCEQYFGNHQIPEHQWADIATMHFTGKAHRWKQGYLVDKSASHGPSSARLYTKDMIIRE